jgi:outer membrane lipoprotein-sorting protein
MLMRSCFLTSVFVSLFLLLAGAASAEEPRALLDRALSAHGGAARLERTKKGHLKAKSEGNQSNVPFKVEIEEWFDLPSRYKEISDGSSNGAPYHVEKVVTEKESWIRGGTGPMHYLSPREAAYRAALASLVSNLLLLRDKDIQLTSLPDKNQDGRTFAGIRAMNPQGSSDFYFDKSTGLLAQTQVMPNRIRGREEIEETFYEDYRDIQGIHYPMRFKTSSGKTYSATVTISSIEFSDKIDESVFLKPWLPAAESQASSENVEKTSAPRDTMLIIATVGAGVVIGAVWFIVRACKRSKRETPPS